MSKDSPARASGQPEVDAALHRLGERIRAHRRRLGWTIADISARLFCAPATYRAIEAGKSGTSVGILANALWLLGQLDSIDQLAPVDASLAAAFAKGRVRHASAAPVPGRVTDAERDF